MPPNYTIRPAQPADLNELVALQLALQDHLEASNAGLWRMVPEARALVRGQLAGRIAAAGSWCLVAEHTAGGLAGAIYGRVVVNTHYIPRRSGTVDQLYVRPEHRRRGVAMCLVAALCDFFEREGIDDLSLRYVHGNHEAVAFWAALGFTPRIVTVGAARTEVQARVAR